MTEFLFPVQTVLTFTGHRPDKLIPHLGVTAKGLVKAHVREQIRVLKPSLAISGMALGLDTWAAEVCVEDGIPFIAAVPFLGQESRWLPGDCEVYRGLLERAQRVHVVCAGAYSPSKFQKRNEWMVDRATTVLALWDGTSGGTGNCVKYAVKQRVKTLVLDPSAGFRQYWL